METLAFFGHGQCMINPSSIQRDIYWILLRTVGNLFHNQNKTPNLNGFPLFTTFSFDMDFHSSHFLNCRIQAFSLFIRTTFFLTVLTRTDWGLSYILSNFATIGVFPVQRLFRLGQPYLRWVCKLTSVTSTILELRKRFNYFLLGKKKNK